MVQMARAGKPYPLQPGRRNWRCRNGQTLPRTILSVPEVESILIAKPMRTIRSGLRDRALLELLYSTGLRRMEAAISPSTTSTSPAGCVMVREGKAAKIASFR